MKILFSLMMLLALATPTFAQKTQTFSVEGYGNGSEDYESEICKSARIDAYDTADVLCTRENGDVTRSSFGDCECNGSGKSVNCTVSLTVECTEIPD